MYQLCVVFVCQNQPVQYINHLIESEIFYAQCAIIVQLDIADCLVPNRRHRDEFRINWTFVYRANDGKWHLEAADRSHFGPKKGIHRQKHR